MLDAARKLTDTAETGVAPATRSNCVKPSLSVAVGMVQVKALSGVMVSVSCAPTTGLRAASCAINRNGN